MTGTSDTQMADPAKLFAFGNTHDTRRATMGGIGWFFDNYNGPSKNNAIWFDSRVNIVFADSHASAVPFKGGDNTTFGDKVGTPKNFDVRVNGYCSDPDANIRPFPRDGFPLGVDWTCRTFLAFPEASGTTWWQD